MVYTILFLIGILGLGAMLLLGFGHAGGHGGHSGHIGHDAGHSGHIGHGAHGHDGHGHHGDESRGTSGWFWQLLSPLTLMSFCLGAGATGLIVRDLHASSTFTALAAALGAVAFYALIVKPLFALAFRFVSEPSKALEGATAKTAEAASKFDASGRGVVTLNVDGQLVRVLAELEQDDRLAFDTIRPGDSLTITAVDGHTNTCKVARM